nr:pantothenate kinase 1-like [Quercus suber]
MERSKCQQLEEVEGFRFNGLITQQQPFNHQNPTLLFPKLPIDNDSSLISLDIGGTLVKVVYLVRENKKCVTSCSDGAIECHTLDGTLHFVKFETKFLNQWIQFLHSQLLCFVGESSDVKPTGFHKNMTIKATGGGAYKYADIFRDRLDITFDIVDEIASTVAGANFLLQEIDREAFTHISGKKTYVNIDHCDLFPYLLVNIGSGVSIIKVTGNKKFERVTGTQFGGGTIFGFASLLTNCQSYDELLEISQHGDNRALDLTVGDIYGDTGYPEHNISASAIASCFGKVNGNKKLSGYKAEDMAASLLRNFTYLIAQISYLVAAPLGIKRICFGGSYIRGHASTMDNISYGLNFWSKGQVAAVFLQHEGFLGAVGALLNYKKIDLNILAPHKLTAYDSSRLSDVGEEFHGRLEERVEDRLNREVERLKAELDRLQNDKATLVKKLKNLESKLCKLCGSCSKLCSSCETSNISQ